jgi:hypothetical protein
MDGEADNDGLDHLTPDDEVDGSSDASGDPHLDSPFWDLLLYAAICAVGAGAAVALRRHPWAVGMAVLAAIVVLVVLASRLAGRRWTLRDYVMFSGFVIGGLCFAVFAFLVLWVSVCSC